MKLIDADELIEAHYDACTKDHDKAFETWSLKLMKQAPAIDAVPVVHCGECAWSQYDELFGLWFCNGVEIPKDGFCHMGERRE